MYLERISKPKRKYKARSQELEGSWLRERNWIKYAILLHKCDSEPQYIPG